ncbi:MAG: protein-disulfide reductase DsbD N-terminal domain-containing protein [Gammaproteobacteria bacterium]|nr:protein-disulfide reductase DsbD N-terminal domain-containing protein [Gammaproteobacteria bacterium]
MAIHTNRWLISALALSFILTSTFLTAADKPKTSKANGKTLDDVIVQDAEGTTKDNIPNMDVISKPRPETEKFYFPKYEAFGGGKIMDPRAAFPMQVSMRNANTLEIRFTPAPDHYLYRQGFVFFVDTPGVRLGEAEMSPGIHTYDEFYGEVEIYSQFLTITIPVDYGNKSRPGGALQIRVQAQGCNSKEGVCYQPFSQTAMVTVF